MVKKAGIDSTGELMSVVLMAALIAIVGVGSVRLWHYATSAIEPSLVREGRIGEWWLRLALAFAGVAAILFLAFLAGAKRANMQITRLFYLEKGIEAIVIASLMGTSFVLEDPVVVPALNSLGLCKLALVTELAAFAALLRMMALGNPRNARAVERGPASTSSSPQGNNLVV